MTLARIIQGDCMAVLPTLAPESVNCCVTSPPYWGLRDYGVTGQLGLERTPEEYVARMVAVFREVRRVLRDDGTLWLNLGDSYASGGAGGDYYSNGLRAGQPHHKQRRDNIDGLKPKDLVGIPWRVAFALQADGWVLRSDIVWAKPNPMPESVTDRPTKSHEMLFLFSKARWVGEEPGRFAHISDEDARWLALFLDTEGCIVVKRAKIGGRCDSFAPQVAIGSTCRALLERVVEIVGHGNILERPGKNAPMHCWQLGSGIAADFLRVVYRHLIVKRRQARIGIHVDSLLYYRGGKTPERKKRTNTENDVLMSLWARCKACNHFQSPDLSDVPEPGFGRWDSQTYYYDAAAIAEPAIHAGREIIYDGTQKNCSAGDEVNDRATLIKRPVTVGESRNRRSVWTVATQPYPDAHFATFPPKLIEPCILAGCPPGGVVLDPFAGSGTTGQVAQKYGRGYILIELNHAYIEMIHSRLKQQSLPLASSP